MCLFCVWDVLSAGVYSLVVHPPPVILIFLALHIVIRVMSAYSGGCCHSAMISAVYLFVAWMLHDKLQIIRYTSIRGNVWIETSVTGDAELDSEIVAALLSACLVLTTRHRVAELWGVLSDPAFPSWMEPTSPGSPNPPSSSSEVNTSFPEADVPISSEGSTPSSHEGSTSSSSEDGTSSPVEPIALEPASGPISISEFTSELNILTSSDSGWTSLSGASLTSADSGNQLVVPIHETAQMFASLSAGIELMSQLVDAYVEIARLQELRKSDEIRREQMFSMLRDARSRAEQLSIDLMRARHTINTKDHRIWALQHALNTSIDAPAPIILSAITRRPLTPPSSPRRRRVTTAAANSSYDSSFSD